MNGTDICVYSHMPLYEMLSLSLSIPLSLNFWADACAALCDSAVVDGGGGGGES